jgi:hypothetical protein
LKNTGKWAEIGAFLTIHVEKCASRGCLLELGIGKLYKEQILHRTAQKGEILVKGNPGKDNS